MIDVQINREDGMTQVSIVGHSGYADIGSDIVCAGVSALAQTYVSVIDVKDCRRLILDNGFLDIVTEDNEANEIRLEFLKSGLMDIESQYSENVRISENEKII